MKVNLGGSASIKIMVFQYEPIEVTTSFSIEKEFKTDEEANDYAISQSEKINEFLKQDLEKKVKEVAKKQSDLKKKLKEII